MDARTGKLVLGTSAAAMYLGTSFANAADNISAPDYGTDWSGPYLGAHLGVGDLKLNGIHDSIFLGNVFDFSSLSEMGNFSGAQIGWNFDAGDWILGAEADISAVDFGRSTVDKLGDPYGLSTDYMGSVRARLGKPIGNALIYGTGGIAFINGELSLNAGRATRNINEQGVILGGGIATMFAPNVSLAVEGFWTRFDSSIDLNGVAGGVSGDRFELQETFTTRFALNYHFGKNAGIYTANSVMPDYDWDGFYIGGMLGHGGITTHGRWDSTDADVDLAGVSDPGFTYGAQIGWSQVNGNWLYGIEGDISQLGWSGSTGPDHEGDTHELQTNYLATLRGRLGFISGDTLFYGTAGLANIDTTLGLEIGAGGNPTSYKDFNVWGGVFGAGLETFLTPNMTMKAEALYLVFDESSNLNGLPDGDAGDSFTLYDGFTFRLGLNWHF